MSSSNTIAYISIGFYSVSVIVLVATMTKLIRSGEHKECKKIILFFILSNIGAIIATSTNIALYNYISPRNTSNSIVWVLVVVNSIGYIMF